jgi:hypothetical protein
MQKWPRHSADSKRSGEYGYGRGIVGVLLLSLVTGVVYYLCSSRKVIILDLTEADASHILAFAAAILALGLVY